MDGVARLASLFKERENQPYLGPQIGMVVNPLPDIKIKLNDRITLDKEDLIIAEHLVFTDAVFYEVKSDKTVKLTGDLPGSNDDLDTKIGELTFYDGTKPGDERTIMDINITEGTGIEHSGEYLHQDFVLKPGDEVILIPSTDEQRYFVIDKAVRP